MYRTHPVVERAVAPLHAAVPDDLVGIHGVLYDPRDLDHPGGETWIALARGTDCTELFEMSHLDIARARRLLATLPTRGTYARARRSRWAHYARLRAVALRHFPTRASRRERSPTPHRLWVAAAVAAHAALPLATPATGAWVAACAAVATCNTVLGGFGHNYLHQLDPRALWLEWNGLSSLEWLLEHVSSHHPYPNTAWDHDAISMQPFVYWDRATWRNLVAYPLFVVGEIVVAAQGYVGHRCRWRARWPGAPAWLRYAPWVFVARAALYLSLLGVASGACTLLLTMVLAGTYFSYLAHLNHATSGPPTDCVVLQQLRNTADLALSSRSANPHSLPTPTSLLSPLRVHIALFLDRQTVHHLFPTVDHSRLDGRLRRALAEAASAETRHLLRARRDLSAVLRRRLVPGELSLSTSSR